MRFTVAVAVACLIGGVSIADEAQASIRRQTNIPAQNLGEALQTLANDRDVQVVYFSAAVDTLRTQGAAGELTTDEAFAKVLRGTGLTYRHLGEKTITIVPIAATGSVGTQLRTDEYMGAMMIGTRATDEQNEADVSSVQASTEEVNPSEPVRLEEIVVTGSHIRGEDPAGSHVITIDRDTIYKSGYGRLEDLLATLPQNFTGTSELASQQNVSNLARGSEVQLRGLGPGTTLTLVNGQRAPSSGTQGAFVDISNIPAAAIERIEILPDGASALYGSDAIGGVVNVILRKDFQGAETSARFGEASGGQAKEVEVSQLLGTHWSAGHVLVGYQYTRRDDLIAGSRPYTATSFNLVPFGGSDFRTVGGNPGEILNARRQPAFGIPTGQDGTHLTALQLLPGVINYQELPYLGLLPKQAMHSVFASMSQDLNDRAQLFLDARYSTRSMKLIYAGTSLPLRVPSSNPFYVNPFGGSGPVTVDYDFTPDLGPTIQDGAEDTFMATAGTHLRLVADWHLTLSSSYARDSTAFDWSNLTNSKALAAALADTDPATALNVFGDGSHTNPATLATIRASRSEHGVDTTQSTTAVADGSLFDLPSGAVRLALGAEYRRDTLRGTSNGVDAYLRASDGRRDFASFAEVAVPLISAAQRVPLVHKLELSLAGRYDDYSDVGSTTNPKLGATWTIVEALKLRGTWGRSFRAPPFYLSDPDIRTNYVLSRVVPDPISISSTGTSNVLYNGATSPELRPETAKTWTVGIDFQPLDNLLFSTTYFDINYNNRIAQPPDSDPLAVESHYANTGVIIRNPTQAQVTAVCNQPNVYVQNDCTGPFAAIINSGLRNLAASRMKGLDFEAAYHRLTAMGTLGVGVSGTYIFNDDQVVTQASPTFDVADTVENPLALRLQSTLSWSLHGWSATAIINHTGSYTDKGSVPIRRVDSWTTVNLSVGYEVPDGLGLLSNTRVLLTARNIFDKLPPFVNESLGFDTANADLFRRTGSIQISKRW